MYAIMNKEAFLILFITRAQQGQYIVFSKQYESKYCV